MQLKHSYYWFKDAISKEECEKIIEIGTNRLASLQEKGISTEGHTYGYNEKGSKPLAMPQGDHTREELLSKGIENTYVRDSQVTWIDEQWVYNKLSKFIQEANQLAGWNFQWDWCEPAQFTVYKPGGFYSWHQDGGGDTRFKRYIHGVTSEPMIDDKIPDGYTRNTNMVGKIRKLSLTLNLTSDDTYEGGNLKFDLGPHAIPRFHECEEARSQGSIVVFPSFIHHCVTPLTLGTRYSLVIWCLGQPFK